MAIYKLGDISDITKGTRFEAGELRLPFLGSGDLSPINYENIRSFKHGIKTAKKGTILLGIEATVGNTAITNTDVVTNQAVAHIVVNKNYINSEYLSLLISKRAREVVKSGAIYKTIRLNDLRELEIEIPSIDVQNEIIDIIKPLEDQLNNINNMMKIAKNLAIARYKSSGNNIDSIDNYVLTSGTKWIDQHEYIATNGVGEFDIDMSKKINIENKRPSRANLVPEKDSFIVSKLVGENKVLYINNDFPFVVSTGFFNIKTDYNDHLLGFLLSDEFAKQKQLLSSGTTMIGLNNASFKKVEIRLPKDKNGVITELMSTLIGVKLNIIALKEAAIKAKIK